MLEKHDAQGRHFGDALNHFERNDPGKYINYIMSHTDEGLDNAHRVFPTLEAYPELCLNSLYIVNAQNSKGNKTNVLSAPAEMAELVPEYEDIDGLPPPGQAFIVLVENQVRGGNPLIEFVIAGTWDIASKIATRRVSEIGHLRQNLVTEAYKIDSGFFVSLAESAIREYGMTINSSAARYAGLRKIQLEEQKRRISEKNNP